MGGGRRRWVGEAIALLSPKSKVLGAVSRAGRRGCRCRLPRASLRPCGEPRHRAPAWSPQPARRDECASGLGEAAAPWTCHKEEDQTLGPGVRPRPDAPIRRPWPPPRAALSPQPSVLHRPVHEVLATPLPPPTLPCLLLSPCLPPPRLSLCLLRSPARWVAVLSAID